MNKVLITGATGNIAGVVLQNLTSSEVAIRALIRDESKAEQLKQMGIEVVFADLEKPDTLNEVFDGVDKILLITPISLHAVNHATNIITAAQQNGKPHIVYVSANVPEPVSETEVGRQRARIEDALVNSGLPYTIIRPTFFMQNTMMAAQTVISDGMVYLPLGEGQLAMLDIRDVGRTIAKVLTSDGHEGKTYTLTGPKCVSMNDVVSILSSVLGKDVRYADVPLEAAKEAMMGLGMPDWLVDMYNELFQNFSQNGANFHTDDIEKITGTRATTYRQFAQDFSGVFSA